MSFHGRLKSLIPLSLSALLLLSGCEGILPNQVNEKEKTGEALPSGDQYRNQDGDPEFVLPLKAAIATLPAKNSLIAIDIEKEAATGEIPVGNNPVGLTLDKKEPRKYAYVANYGSNAISIINLQTATVERFVESGESPWDVEINGEGTYLYAANSGDNTVAVIDVARRVRTRKVQFDKSAFPNFRAREIVTNPAAKDEAFVVSDGNAGSVSSPIGMIVKLNANQLQGAITVNSAIRLTKGAITPNGKRLLVTDQGRPTLWSIDLASFAVTPIALPSPAYDVVIAPDGETAYVSLPDLNAVSGIDLVTNTAGSPNTTSAIHEGAEEGGHYFPQVLALGADAKDLWFQTGGSGGLGTFANLSGTLFTKSPTYLRLDVRASLGDFALIP